MKKNPLLKFLREVDLYISVAALCILTLITFAGTIMRYIFKAPFIWQEEVQMILVVWIVFWGASAAFRTHNHIVIEILVDALPQKLQDVIRAVVDVVTFCMLGLLIYVETSRVLQLIASGRSTSILKIPQAYNYAGVVLACVFMLINFCAAEISYFRGKQGGNQDE